MRVRLCTACWKRINDSDYQMIREMEDCPPDDHTSAASRYCYDCFRKVMGEPVSVAAGSASSKSETATASRAHKRGAWYSGPRQSAEKTDAAPFRVRHGVESGRLEHVGRGRLVADRAVAEHPMRPALAGAAELYRQRRHALPSLRPGRDEQA